MDTYYASTKLEIENSVRKWRRRFHIKHLLIHHGEFRIADGIIFLSNWKKIECKLIDDIFIGDEDFLSPKEFATQSRLFFLKSAKPLKLVLKNGEIIYLYVNWRFGTGLSDNPRIYTRIKGNMR